MTGNTQIKSTSEMRFGQLQGTLIETFNIVRNALVYRHSVFVHDSERCSKKHKKTYGEVHPFPTPRLDGLWTGSGPMRSVQLEMMKKHTCPVVCRPRDHIDWTNC